MTRIHELLEAYEDESFAKWRRYHPNKNTCARNFEKWPRGKTFGSMLEIEIRAQVESKFSAFATPAQAETVNEQTLYRINHSNISSL